MPVNAIDFSDLTGNKKVAPPVQQQQQPPQPPQPQQQLGVKNPKTGQVQPAMGYPVNQMGQGDELLQLFPTPVLIAPYPLDYSKELEWIKNADCRRENKGGDNATPIHYNRQSNDTFVLDRPELANIRAFIESRLAKFVIGLSD